MLSVMVGAELRMVARDTAGLLVPIALPVLILVMNGSGTSQEVVGPGAVTAFDRFVVPLVLTMIVTVIGVVNMPSFLALYRKSGILERLAVTPVKPAMVLAAQVITSIAQTLLGLAIALASAAALFGITPPIHLAAAIGIFALAAGAMYGLGIMVAAVAPSANSAVAIGLAVFFGLGATGGMFGPVAQLPEPVATVGSVLPFGAAVDALGSAWAGAAVDPVSMVSLVTTMAVGCLFAVRFFRWS